jgi:hypothetical protein
MILLAGCESDLNFEVDSSEVEVGVPGLPVLIALGDSVTSGHHGGGTTVVCDDPAYGYPARVFANLQAQSAEDWFRPEQYVNLAHSGYGTAQVLAGGNNGCGQAVADVPITKAVELLTAHANAVKPNRVVISVGINNTNWVAVLTGMTKIYAASEMPSMTAAECENLLQNGYTSPTRSGFPWYLTFAGWNGPAVSNAYTTGLTNILNQLIAADSNALISVVGYYNMANTGMSADELAGPFMPEVCTAAVASRLAQLNGDWITDIAIPATTDWPNNVSFVSTSSLDGQNDKLQGLTGMGTSTVTRGWPHPNGDGANAIGDLIVAAP